MDAMQAGCVACAGTHPVAVDERPCVDIVADTGPHHRICPLDRYIRITKIAQNTAGQIAERGGENSEQLCTLRPDGNPCRWFFGMGYIIEH